MECTVIIDYQSNYYTLSHETLNGMPVFSYFIFEYNKESWKYMYLSRTIRRHLQQSLQRREFPVLLISVYAYYYNTNKKSST